MNLSQQKLLNNVSIVNNLLSSFYRLFDFISLYLFELHSLGLHPDTCFPVHLLHSHVFMVYSFICPSHWINFINRSVIRSYVSIFSDSFLHPFSSVYILLHHKTSFFYIGETIQTLFSRLHQHQYSAAHTEIPSNSDFCHRFLRDNDASSFVILPICTSDLHSQTMNTRKLLEIKFIQQLQPKLNTRSAPFNTHISSYSTRSHRRRRRPSKHQRKKLLLCPSKNSIPITAPKNPRSILSSYICHVQGKNRQYFDLSMLLQFVRSHRYVSITKFRGLFDITNWKLVQKIARNSELIHINNIYFIPTHMYLKHFCFILKRVDKIQFTILLQKESQYIINTQQLNTFLYHRYSWKKELNQFPLSHLLSILIQSKTSTNNLQKIIIKNRIKKIIYKRFDISLIPFQIILRIPFVPPHLQQIWKRKIRTLIHHLPLKYNIHYYIHAITTFVHTKSENIKTLLTNHIKTSKQYTNNPPPCICSLLQTVLEQPISYTHGHFAIRPYQFKNDIRFILDGNSMNIPIPSINSVQISLSNMLDSLYQQIYTLLSPITSQFIIEHIKPIIHFINNISIYLPTSIYIPTIDQILSLKQSILQYCVVSTIDKNANQLLVMCPQLYHYYLTNTFVHDSHYVLCPYKSQQQWCTSTLIFYESINGSYYGKYNYSGTLGYAYCLPKHKNLERIRPIVSFCNHPLKHILRIVGRCLQFLILQLDEFVPHYILHRTIDLKIKLQNYLKQIEKQFSSSTPIEFICITSDIKNMFTELSHSSILDSIIWLISTAIQCHSRTTKILIVEKRNKGIVHWYPYYGEHNEFVFIDITTFIPSIVQFDLAHIDFTLGILIFQQLIGCPMGGFLSAFYAIITCSHYESKFHTSLISNSHIFNARYMDDLLSIHTINSKSNKQRKRTHERIHALIHDCYDRALELELTSSLDGHDKQLTYLDCQLIITNDPRRDRPSIILQPLMKNSESIGILNKQIFVHFQHWNSYSPISVKYGVIKSTVLRYYRNSNQPNVFLNSMLQLQQELKILKYPSYILINTLKSCFHTYNIAIYQHSYQIMQAIDKYKQTNKRK